jgi:glycosyltransferase involved in cell wall biosynthesis
MPSLWDEPFGMVAIEAMACGTPVVTTNRGGPAETVTHEITGLLCDNIDQLPRAIERAAAIDSYLCRTEVRTRFSGKIMARGYERAYARALDDYFRTPVAIKLEKHYTEIVNKYREELRKANQKLLAYRDAEVYGNSPSSKRATNVRS